MAGRPRKVIDISTGKIGKAKREARQENEKKYKLSRDALAPPEWLDPQAKEEFVRVVTEAGQVDILDNLDRGILAIYANAWSRYTELAKVIMARGYGEIGMRDSKYGEYETISPYIKAEGEYVKQIMQCSTKLGMATTDRLKLVVPVKEENHVNKYLKYLDG